MRGTGRGARQGERQEQGVPLPAGQKAAGALGLWPEGWSTGRGVDGSRGKGLCRVPEGAGVWHV